MSCAVPRAGTLVCALKTALPVGTLLLHCGHHAPRLAMALVKAELLLDAADRSMRARVAMGVTPGLLATAVPVPKPLTCAQDGISLVKQGASGGAGSKSSRRRKGQQAHCAPCR